MRKKILILIIIIILAGLVYDNRQRLLNWWEEKDQEPVPQAVTKEEAAANQNINENNNASENSNLNKSAPEEVVLPQEFNLAVPFTTQSPYAEWTEQDNESCEEAAALIVHYYWQEKTFTKEIAKDELNKIVAFEEDYFGFYKDTDTEQTAELIRELWGYEKVEVVFDPTLEEIKKQVYAGRPVILPTAGRELGNPNFRSPGPLYHMLVVRGWTKSMIITNDPGTRKGENYQYSPDVLYNAIHDWNGGDIYNGRRAMLVVYENI